jgi:hypothetical protein
MLFNEILIGKNPGLGQLENHISQVQNLNPKPNVSVRKSPFSLVLLVDDQDFPRLQIHLEWKNSATGENVKNSQIPMNFSFRKHFRTVGISQFYQTVLCERDGIPDWNRFLSLYGLTSMRNDEKNSYYIYLNVIYMSKVGSMTAVCNLMNAS